MEQNTSTTGNALDAPELVLLINGGIPVASASLVAEAESNLPSTYAEIEYDDFDDPEAILGARFDDMNYLHYMER